MKGKILYLAIGSIIFIVGLIFIINFINASTPNTWETNFTINASLTGIGDLEFSSPSVFNMSGTWYMISGDFDGKFHGYAWNETQWLPNSTINASLPTIEATVSSPSVFYKDSSWYLISGKDDGNFYGYTWSGTQWETNLTINASLPNIGAYSRFSVFYKDSDWYLISGDISGDFYGFIYT
jgi:hypothetical protein